MPFAAALSTTADSTMAIAEVCARALQQLQGTPELALLFFSPHHAPSAVEIAATAQEQLNARCFLGCGGESIVGNDQEIEAQPAMSLWLGR